MGLRLATAGGHGLRHFQFSRSLRAVSSVSAAANVSPSATLVRYGDRGDVNHIAAVLAESPDVDLAEEREFDGRLLLAHGGVDVLDHRRQRRLGLGEIELEGSVQLEVQLVAIAFGDHRDELRQIEDVAGKVRLIGDTHARLDHLFLLREQPDLALSPLRLLDAARELLHHVLRQWRWRALPRLGQEVDEQSVIRLHGMQGDPLRQRYAQASCRPDRGVPRSHSQRPQGSIARSRARRVR